MLQSPEVAAVLANILKILCVMATQHGSQHKILLGDEPIPEKHHKDRRGSSLTKYPFVLLIGHFGKREKALCQFKIHAMAGDRLIASGFWQFFEYITLIQNVHFGQLSPKPKEDRNLFDDTSTYFRPSFTLFAVFF